MKKPVQIPYQATVPGVQAHARKSTGLPIVLPGPGELEGGRREAPRSLPWPRQSVRQPNRLSCIRRYTRHIMNLNRVLHRCPELDPGWARGEAGCGGQRVFASHHLTSRLAGGNRFVLHTSGSAHLVNHSRKNPNARPKLIVRCDGSFYLVLVANQDIQSGEEILYDYGETAKDKLEIFPWLKDS